VLHFIAGLATVVFRFPRWQPARRHRAIAKWSRALLHVVGIQVERGARTPVPAGCLLVLNHVSWLDIFLVNAVVPATFVAKSEIGRWPLVGTLVTRAGTLYIERGSRRAVRRTNERIEAALNEGSVVACFPEGTTSHGHKVGRFHGGLLQPAIECGAPVVPAVLAYREPGGAISMACGYVGDDSLLGSVWRIVSAHGVRAHLEFMEPLEVQGLDRRAVAALSEAKIAGRLEQITGAATSTRPGTRERLRA
jgi:1-acyl-sn-glycerol-3-phosphate acyltransferase